MANLDMSRPWLRRFAFLGSLPYWPRAQGAAINRENNDEMLRSVYEKKKDGDLDSVDLRW